VSALAEELPARRVLPSGRTWSGEQTPGVGITEIMPIGELAAAHGLGFAPHFMTELHVHVAAALHNTTYVEYFPFLDEFVAEPLCVQDGAVVVPDRPGHGIEFRDEVWRPTARCERSYSRQHRCGMRMSPDFGSLLRRRRATAAGRVRIQWRGGMELREIEVFLVLSEELHFGRTAERLHLSQSRVSQSIQAIEARVGGALFERTSRRVRLTALGAQLRDGLRPGFDRIQQAVSDARDVACGPDGEVRVGLLSLAAGGAMFDAVVERFEHRFPACRVEVLEAFPGKALERLRSGELDALVHWLPLQQPGLSVGPTLLDAASVLAVRVGHPLAERGWACLEDLGDNAVLDAEGVLPAETLDELMPRFTPSGRPIQRRGREGRMAEVLSLVARGQVVHPTVASVGDHYRHPAVVLVPMSDAPRRRAALVWMTERASPALRAFVAFAEQHLSAGGAQAALSAISDDPATGSPPW